MRWINWIFYRLKFLIGKLLRKISLHGPEGSEVVVDIDEVVSIDFDESTGSIIIIEKGKEPKWLPVTDWNIHVAASHAAHLIERMKKASARIKRHLNPSKPNFPNEPKYE
jgi:accessory colonization factor AcfC